MEKGEGGKKRKLCAAAADVVGDCLYEISSNGFVSPHKLLLMARTVSGRGRRRGANPDPNPSGIAERAGVGSCQADHITLSQLTIKPSARLVEVSENGRGVRHGAEILQLPSAFSLSSSPPVPSDSVSLCV